MQIRSPEIGPGGFACPEGFDGTMDRYGGTAGVRPPGGGEFGVGVPGHFWCMVIAD